MTEPITDERIMMIETCVGYTDADLKHIAEVDFPAAIAGIRQAEAERDALKAELVELLEAEIEDKGQQNGDEWSVWMPSAVAAGDRLVDLGAWEWMRSQGGRHDFRKKEIGK